MNTRGNKATHSRESILAHAKNVLKIIIPAIQRMPKIERIEGAAPEMKSSLFSIISEFTIAWNCPEVRLLHIQMMIGQFGRFMAAFEIAIQQGLFTDNVKVRIAEELERIEDGLMKWRNAIKNKQPISGAEAGQ